MNKKRLVDACFKESFHLLQSKQISECGGFTPEINSVECIFETVTSYAHSIFGQRPSFKQHVPKKSKKFLEFSFSTEDQLFCNDIRKFFHIFAEFQGSRNEAFYDIPARATLLDQVDFFLNFIPSKLFWENYLEDDSKTSVSESIFKENKDGCNYSLEFRERVVDHLAKTGMKPYKLKKTIDDCCDFVVKDHVKDRPTVGVASTVRNHIAQVTLNQVEHFCDLIKEENSPVTSVADSATHLRGAKHKIESSRHIAHSEKSDVNLHLRGSPFFINQKM